MKMGGGRNHIMNLGTDYIDRSIDTYIHTYIHRYIHRYILCVCMYVDIFWKVSALKFLMRKGTV